MMFAAFAAFAQQKSRAFNPDAAFVFQDSLFKIPAAKPEPLDDSVYYTARYRPKVFFFRDSTMDEDESLQFLLHTRQAVFSFQSNEAEQVLYSCVGYIPLLRSYLIGHCSGSKCENYLLDSFTSKACYMPHEFDWGIDGLKITNEGRFVVVYDSYFDSGWENTASLRSQYYIFRITGGEGLDGLIPAYRVTFTDWSIAEIIWLNNSELGLKVYRGERSGDSITGEYEYYRITLPGKE